MITLVKHQTAHPHDVVAHQLDADDRARAGADIIERLMPTVVAGYRAADDLTLAHEAERLEGLEPTALIVRMRAIVAEVQAGRARAVVGRG